MKVKSESGVAQSCPTLSDPMDRSLPGSSIHGIFQARGLEWGAIAFSTYKLSTIKILHDSGHRDIFGVRVLLNFMVYYNIDLWTQFSLMGSSTRGR